MAQYFNYAALPTIYPNYDGLANAPENFMKGMKLGDMPRQMKYQAQMDALNEQLKRNEAFYAPQMADAELQSKDLSNQYQSLKNANAPQEFAAGGQPNLSGDAANAVAVEQMASQFGEKDPRVMAARKALSDQSAYQQSMADYRNMYASTIDKRTATTLGKQNLELDDINAGFMPGTSRSVPLTQEQQQSLQNRYNLAIQKGTSDTSSRQKALYAQNIDKTIASINPDSLFQYSGVTGSVNKAKEGALGMFGMQSEDYANYVQSKQAADLLAHQVRQFYGDSIQPAMTKRIEQMTNPESITKDPKLARKAYDEVISILQKETQTYQQSLKGTQPYEEQGQQQALQSAMQGQQKQPANSGIVTLTNDETGETMQMTVEQAKAQGYM